MGADPKGVIVFAPTGHFTLILARSDLPEFDRTKATPGTYAVNVRGNKRILLRQDFNAGSQRQVSTMVHIKSLTADELELVISEPYGEAIHLAWKRAK